MKSSTTALYGANQIRRSLRHFLVGKGIKVVSSLILLVVLARMLSTAEYAAYVVFQAIIMFAGTLLSFGIESVVSRYIPELRQNALHAQAWALLKGAVVVRAATLGLFFLLAALLSNSLPVPPGIAAQTDLIHLALATGLCRLTVLTFSQGLESFLWQREAQYSLALGNLTRVITITWIAVTSELTLEIVLYVELLSEVVSFVALLVGARRQSTREAHARSNDVRWWQSNRTRVRRFAMTSWVISLTSLLYGMGSVRILAAKFLPVADIAMFGFADNAAQLARRFSPARLFTGIVRPVFFSRYTDTGDTLALSNHTNVIVKTNAFILLFAVTGIVLTGDELLGFVTAGKYNDASWILAGLLAVVAVDGLRNILDVLAQAIERNSVIIIGNTVQSLLVIASLLGINYLGVWALVAGLFVGSVMASIAVLVMFRRSGNQIRLDVSSLLRILAVTAIAIALGQTLVAAGVSTWIATPVSLCVLLGGWYGWGLLKHEELGLIRKLAGRKNAP